MPALPSASQVPISDGGMPIFETTEHEPLRVAVIGDDPLARRVIIGALGEVAERVEVVASVDAEALDGATEDLLTAQAWLWDLGPSFDAEEDPYLAPPGGQPIVALAPDARSATAALRDAGAVAALSREADGIELATALEAAGLGLTTLDERFLDALLTPTMRNPMPEPDEEHVELTARELEVLELLAEGRSNREVALALDISSHTAKFHIGGILQKLDAATRTEAVVRALRLGVLAL